MGIAGDLLLTLVGLFMVAVTPLEGAFAALVAFWLLVPGSLVVPHAPHFLLVDRVVLYVFAMRLVVRRGPREPNSSAFAITPLHAALSVLLVVGFADGVVLTPRTTGLAGAIYGWIPLLDLSVLFVVLMAVIRTITPRKAISIVGCVFAVVVAIGFWERYFLHQGWSHFFFEGLPTNYLGAGAPPLTTRGGHVRSQAASQFALEYGWVLAMLLPLAILAATQWARRWRRARLGLLLPLFGSVAVVFSASRGAEVAVFMVTLLFVLLGGGRNLTKWGIGALGLAALFAIANPSFVSKAFTTAGDPASVRLNRLPVLFALAVHHPFSGLGFNSLTWTFLGLDDGYARIYAELGVLGLLAWLTLIVTAIVTVGRVLTAPRSSEVRVVGAACLVGIVAVAAAASTYDITSTPQSLWALVFLAALGTVAAEKVPRREPTRQRRWLARCLLPLGGVGMGVIVLASSPVGASESLFVFTEAPWVSAVQGVGSGHELVNTLCPMLTSPDVVATRTQVTCVQGQSVIPSEYPGLALITVSAPTPGAVRKEISLEFDPIRRRMLVFGGPSGTIHTGRPAWGVTAPLWGGTAGLVAMLLIPPLPRRRRSQRDYPRRRFERSVNTSPKTHRSERRATATSR